MPLLNERTYTLEDIYALPEGQRAELIGGQIYDMSPPNRIHQKLVIPLPSKTISTQRRALAMYILPHSPSLS